MDGEVWPLGMPGWRNSTSLCGAFSSDSWTTYRMPGKAPPWVDFPPGRALRRVHGEPGTAHDQHENTNRHPTSAP
ncbi:hypothetical protein [Streptomyces sp. NPDC092370]|uniref:hypothetical protein n=1 Tax=Streptomyces sp. NPDC092370 TaxID=3366016 RepID=UPI003810F1C7